MLKVPTTGERVARSAYRFWMRAKMTAWPTVRHVARSLKIRIKDIADCEADGWYFTQSHNVEDRKAYGDMEIVATTDEVERAWTAYWAPFQGHPCTRRGAKNDGHQKQSG